jgi:hypothetical protein
VLQGNTRGYRNHPQLQRFKQQKDPSACLASYLTAVWQEADRRGYHFDASKIAMHKQVTVMPLNSGQLAYEFSHLAAKLKQRDGAAHVRLMRGKTLLPHPLFKVITGDIELWEIVPASV